MSIMLYEKYRYEEWPIYAGKKIKVHMEMGKK